MKKIIRKLKGKKVLSLVLAAIMLATTFNMALPVLKLDASAADITIDGVSQTRVVSNYESTYENYAAQYLNGAGKPTNIVIPGLDPAQDYVIQGLSYYAKKDWLLVTAYHNDETESSKIFCLDAATGDFFAMITFLNSDGTENKEHGGGIAVSEHNLYYACGDKDRDIAYVSLKEIDKIEKGDHAKIKLEGRHTFVEVGSITENDKTAYTAYVCYDEGILWTGNFYDPGAEIIGGLSITKVAADYNAGANNTYKSMVFGYKLKGSDSQEEWNNLIGATGTDCQGNPSHAIGLNNAIKDVQYAVVDNGKLYLSRSYGSGAGNSVSFGFGETSLLTVADIDLSQPGTESVKIATKTTGTLDKTISVHNISETQDYEMMPMSEGLCFIDDQLFITFEGASNKYKNESSSSFLGIETSISNCEKPVDVIWQLDPYELVELEKPAQEKSLYYERVDSLTDIENGKEYIILFESAEKDPVTQNNILYAFDSYGNFNGHKLSKGNKAGAVGYDGMIGHKITEYTVETVDNAERLYLSNPEKDDVTSVRWIINNISGSNYRIKSTDTYFANYKNFFVDEDEITMAPDDAQYLSNLHIEQLSGPGYFYVSRDKANYLWCNDGTNQEWMDKADDYYAAREDSNPIYRDLEEVAGTFHCNATASPILGGTVPAAKDDYPDIYYPDGAFKIYRREVDSSVSTYESRVYTNLDTKLEADGTYTVTLDTYAISPNHYRYSGEKATDYIIVADASYSMSKTGSAGLKKFDGELRVNSLATKDQTKNEKPDGIIGYKFYNPDFDIRYNYNGKYYKLYMAIRNTWDESTKQYYYLYFIGDDGLYHCFTNQQKKPDRTYDEANFKKWVAGDFGDNPYQTASSSEKNNTDRQKEPLFTGEHYRYDNINNTYNTEHVIFDALKITAKDIVDKIGEQNPENRVAITYYEKDINYLGANGWASSGFTDAFWNAKSNADNLKTQIDNIGIPTDTDEYVQNSNDGLELYAAEQIIANSGVNYKAGENRRNVAVIFLSDGIPGIETPEMKKEGCSEVFASAATTYGDATKAATNVIAKAKKIKDNGAFIYTVLFGNNSAGEFQKKVYMDAVSSKYPAATAMDKDKLGGQSVDGVTYALNCATCSYDVFSNFGNITCREVEVNNSVGLDNLSASSYLRQVFNSGIIIPKDYTCTAQFVPGVYDEIGRFSFLSPEDTNAITPVLDRDKKTLTVTGYEYSKYYISKDKTDGKALRIIIKGLLADETKNLKNAAISINEKTGVYKDADNMAADIAFRNLPSEYINIPEYTYVLDYGIQMLDQDVNGTLCSVSNDLSKQTTYNTVSPNGALEISTDKQDLLYSVSPDKSAQSGYSLIQRPDGTYDWFKINVVPASNVLYEETAMTMKSGNNVVDWTPTGTPISTSQDLSKDGDVYGFDNNYDNSYKDGKTNPFSNGTTYKSITQKSSSRSKTATFQFTGTGFDLISACGKHTGIQIVQVKETKKVFIVDTYNDSSLIGDSDYFTQVPIVKYNAPNRGTYTVEVTAAYLSNAQGLKQSTVKNNRIDTGLTMSSAGVKDTARVEDILDSLGIEDYSAEDVELIWFDDNSILNGGTGPVASKNGSRARTVNGEPALENYIDGFRVYNPVASDNAAYSDTEKNAVYANVIDNLAPVNSADGSAITDVSGIAYLTNSGASQYTFAQYLTEGPKGELYLKDGKAISFKIKRGENERVMLGLRAVNGETSITVNGGEPYSFPIKSATEMYYDISKCITTTDDVIITVENTGDKLLAVNHIKFTGSNGSNGTVIAPRSMARSANGSAIEINKFLTVTQEDLTAIETSMSAEPIPAEVKNGVVIPVIEEEEIIPDDNTTPDDNNTNDNTNNGTNTDSDDAGDTFDIFSLLKLLIEFIKEILFNSVGSGKLL